MHTTPDFPDLLRLLDERSGAFLALVAAAPDLGVPVPTCPGWTLFDLAEHVGQGRRRWATIVAFGPADQRPAGTAPTDGPPAPRAHEALQRWLAESVAELDAALRDAGPDRGCWAWWPESQSPLTAGAVARHQLQEVAVHTYDAQVGLGAPQPLPDEAAVDGVEEFLSTCNATTYPWPHAPATLDYVSTEGPAWRLWLDGDGARFARLPDGGAPADAATLTGRGSASQIVLSMYGRIPVRSLTLEGDSQVLDRLVDWVPGD
ncbi:maleylpyruvate isomerase family mycothiol-dependent enzyme [Pedococcus bigeumensis]|uniref:maleylpyruvate isomerase family mycothiol-dependent enzyme n=1 Tax=Pedococcus bigeumensis TaxID=433644 RepID=UPI002FEC30D1